MSEFNFIENCGWLHPFLIQIKKQYPRQSIDDETIDQIVTDTMSEEHQESIIFTNTTLTFQDAIDFASYNINAVFRNKCVTMSHSTYSWSDCLEKCNQFKYIRCRTSRGFGNRYVPFTKKFNPLFYNEKYKEVVLLAEYSYHYLYYHTEIEALLKTPLSDYTRFNDNTNENVLNRIFMTNLRKIQSSTSIVQSPFDQLLAAYDSKN